ATARSEPRIAWRSRCRLHPASGEYDSHPVTDLPSSRRTMASTPVARCANDRAIADARVYRHVDVLLGSWPRGARRAPAPADVAHPGSPVTTGSVGGVSTAAPAHTTVRAIDALTTAPSPITASGPTVTPGPTMAPA